VKAYSTSCEAEDIGEFLGEGGKTSRMSAQVRGVPPQKKYTDLSLRSE